jgi:hypothetical protein
MNNDFKYRYHATGKVRYSNHHDENGSGWVVIDCPNDIVHYYNSVVRWLKWIKFSTPLHGSHITVVNGNFNFPKIDNWYYRDKEEVDFYYGTIQDNAEGYYWLPVECDAVHDIRIKLGLKPQLKFQPHLTIGYEQR